MRLFSETLVSNNYIQCKILHFLYTWVNSRNLPQPFIQTKNDTLRGWREKKVKRFSCHTGVHQLVLTPRSMVDYYYFGRLAYLTCLAAGRLISRCAMYVLCLIATYVSTAWSTFFPSFVASGTKNTYVECTKALRHLVSTYLQYDMKPPPLQGVGLPIARRDCLTVV